MPILAAGAAQLRGVPVAEVCTVSGFALPPTSYDHDAGYSGHDGHGSQPAALAALSGPDTPSPSVALAQATVPDLPFKTRAAFRDARAIWVVRLEHGPPRYA